MTIYNDDSEFDAALRNVPVPEHIAARLKSLTAWTDDELHRSLTEVPVASSFAARLKAIPSDEPWEQQLNAVEPNSDFRERLYALAASEQARLRRAAQALSPWWQALSLGLLLAMASGYSLFAWQLMQGLRPITLAKPELALMLPAGHDSSLPGTETAAMLVPGGEKSLAPPPVESLSNLPDPIGPDLPLEPVKEAVSASPPVIPLEPAWPPANEAKLANSMRALRNYILGAPVLSERNIVELESVSLPVAQGMPVPFVPGFDRNFLMRTRVHPPVQLTTNRALAQTTVPLHFETESFDRAVRLTSQGKRPTRDQIRPEDFLAAMRSDLPAPTSPAPICTVAGGPSPFGPAGSRWLGINVRSGLVSQRKSASTHLVIAVELSPRLVQSGTWAWLRQGLLEMLGRCQSQDRVSIILVQRGVLLRTEPLDARAQAWLSQALPQQAPFEEPDSGLAMQAAIETAALVETPAVEKRVVLITEGHQTITPEFNRRLRDLGEQLTPAGLGIALADVSGEAVIPPSATAIAEALRCPASKITTRQSLLRFLQTQLLGDVPLTAAEARLLVKFSPDAVNAYRLVGHEANAMAQLTPPALEIDLHAGDETHILLELLPRVGSGPVVAECELQWLEPGTGTARRKITRFRGSQWLSSWEEMPFWLRQAVIASETAEYFRGSRVALRDTGWSSELVQPAKLAEYAHDLSGYAESNLSLPQLSRLLRDVSQSRGK